MTFFAGLNYDNVIQFRKLSVTSKLTPCTVYIDNVTSITFFINHNAAAGDCWRLLKLVLVSGESGLSLSEMREWQKDGRAYRQRAVRHNAQRAAQLHEITTETACVDAINSSCVVVHASEWWPTYLPTSPHHHHHHHHRRLGAHIAVTVTNHRPLHTVLQHAANRLLCRYYRRLNKTPTDEWCVLLQLTRALIADARN